MDRPPTGDATPQRQIERAPTLSADLPSRSPFMRRVAIVMTITVIAGLLLALLLLGINILLATFAGVLVAVFLRALTDFVRKYTPLPDGWALALVLLIILVVIGGAGWLLAPQIAEQTDLLIEQLPEVARRIERFLGEYGWGQWIMDQAEPDALDGMITGNIMAFLGGFTTWITYLLMALFIGLFAAMHPQLYREGMVSLFPLRHRPRMAALVDDLSLTLRWWLIGQALTMMIIGVSVTLVLWAFGIPLAIVVGLMVGLLGFIPYVGPILGAFPVALVAIPEGTEMFIYVMIAYTIVQMLEGYVAVPLVQQRTVYLPPVFTIVAQVLLGTVLGALGFILATPLAAVILVLTRFYRSDILGDPEAKKEEAEEEKEKQEGD
jgi:predicted PurR-regulated permease PerM